MICRRLLACGSSVFAELLEQGGEELDGKQDLVDELVQEVVEEIIRAASLSISVVTLVQTSIYAFTAGICGGSSFCPDNYLRLRVVKVYGVESVPRHHHRFHSVANSSHFVVSALEI